MNKQELIERIEGLKNIFGNKVEYIEIDAAIELVSKLDKPQNIFLHQKTKSMGIEPSTPVNNLKKPISAGCLIALAWKLRRLSNGIICTLF